MTENLQYKTFDNINLEDPFFDSLKGDYVEFSEWFKKKGGNFAYSFINVAGGLEGFLYLKREETALLDVVPNLPTKSRLKIGTFKIHAHGTRLGERFMKKVFDHALEQEVKEIYVTIFEKHTSLVELFKRYGFHHVANKISNNGSELVLLRDLFSPSGNVVADYPLIPIKKNRQFLLALYPKWHTKLLPDSILTNENASIVKDVSHSNSIHKIYLTAMHGIEQLMPGDTLIIYRTKDDLGPAHYRSVVTSVCVVENLTHISKFATFQKFFSYCAPYSVFTEQELQGFYSLRKYPWIIRFTYNLALKKRITRQSLVDTVGLDPNVRWGFIRITTSQFGHILQLSSKNENPLVYKA